jgi:hypothetical protein
VQINKHMSKEIAGMPLATVKLKIDKMQEVVKQHVTPAELMFLVADHHTLAGQDPVLSLKLEYKQEKKLVQDKDPTGQPMVDVMNGQPVMVEALVDTDELATLKLTSVQERRRLSGIYNAKRIGKFYPGTIPNLPQSFDEARENGVQTNTPSERLLEVGGE